VAVNGIAYGLLVPVFFVHIGLVADLRQIGWRTPLARLLVVAVVSKVGGSGLSLSRQLTGAAPRLGSARSHVGGVW
jgi:Kef-type K+ transport system membrane component KefB